MGRPPGARNAGFDSTRAALVRGMRTRLMRADGARVSFRELASAAGVGPATLRHYFGSRTEAIASVLDAARAEGAPYLLLVTRPPTMPLAESLAFLLHMVLRGMRGGLGDLHALGLAAGLRDPALGPGYLDHVLEPTLQAFEAHLAHHAASGALRPGTDLRLAALELLAPVLLAALHQDQLGGARCRALDLDAVLEPHLAAWLRAWAREPAAAPVVPGST